VTFAKISPLKASPAKSTFASAPNVKEIEEVLNKIIVKLTKYLQQQKIIIRDDDEDPARAPPRLQHNFEDDFNQQHFDMSFDNFNQFAD
jgi:hypothetical protein